MRNAPGPSSPRWLLLVPLGLIALLLVAPMLRMVALSFNGDTWFANYATVFADQVFVRSIVRTLVVCAMASVLCAVIAVPVVWEVTRPPTTFRRVLGLVLMLTLWISILVRTYSWILVLQRTGLVNSLLVGAGLVDEPLHLVRNLGGIVVGMVHVLLPFMVLALLPPMRAINPRLIQASRSLGASRFTMLRTVVLPQLRGGLAAGGLLTFILGAAFFVTPAILGSPRDVFVSQLIARRVEVFQEFGIAAAMAVVLTVVVLAGYLSLVRLLDPARLLGSQQ